MSDYRVYVIGDDGHFKKAIPLDCPNDNVAIESAKQFIDGHDIELWQRDRRVARFDTRPKDTSGWLKGELKPPEQMPKINTVRNRTHLISLESSSTRSRQLSVTESSVCSRLIQRGEPHGRRLILSS